MVSNYVDNFAEVCSRVCGILRSSKLIHIYMYEVNRNIDGVQLFEAYSGSFGTLFKMPTLHLPLQDLYCTCGSS